MTMNITNTTITMIITKRRTLSREYFQVSHRQATGKGWKSKNHHHYRIICIILYFPLIKILLRLWKVEIVIFDRICKNLVNIVKFGENIDIFATSIWDGVSVQATSNPDFFSGRPANRRKSSGLFGPWLCQYSSNESFTMSTQVIWSIQHILIFQLFHTLWKFCIEYSSQMNLCSHFSLYPGFCLWWLLSKFDQIIFFPLKNSQSVEQYKFQM